MADGLAEGMSSTAADSVIESQALLPRPELPNCGMKESPPLHGYDSVDKALNLEVGEVQAPDEAPTTQWFRFVAITSGLFSIFALT